PDRPTAAASMLASPLRVAATVVFILMTIAAAKFAGLWPTRAPEPARQQVQNDDARKTARRTAPVTAASQSSPAEERRAPEPQPATRTQADATSQPTASAPPVSSAPSQVTAPAPAPPRPTTPATSATSPGAADDSSARARMQQRLRDAETAVERAKQEALDAEANVRSGQTFNQGERKQREAAALR